MNAKATMCVEWEATERLPEGSCQAQFALRGAQRQCAPEDASRERPPMGSFFPFTVQIAAARRAELERSPGAPRA